MTRTVLARAGLALALAISIPAAGAAQDQPVGPEDSEWHLIGYADDPVAQVPWYVEATLLLTDGQASGSAGCNTFSGSYALDGESLTFDPAFATTRKACPAPWSTVEDGYLAALPQVASWAIEDETLRLNDPDGGLVLEYELPVAALTASDLTAIADTFAEQEARLDELQTAVERVGGRVDNIRIGTLRDRIKTLETAAAKPSGPDLSAFSAAEQVLLGAVRPDIAKTCEPRRSQNPAGTVAALQCQPETAAVADMAYYLMEGGDAATVFEQRMKDNKVKGGTQKRTCALGKPSDMYWVGGGMVAAGCYRNDDGRANLRFTNSATKCRQLTAGNTQLESPHVYIAVLGPDKNIANLWEWAASSLDWEAGGDLFDPIKQPGQPLGDMCPHG